MILFVTAAEATHEGGAAAFPPFDTTHFPSQLFWLALLFGLLYIVLSRFILPRLGGVLEHRESTIANNLDEAARMNDKAVETQHALETSIAQAQAKARETANVARQKIDTDIAAETSRVDADLAEKLAAAEARISKLRDQAMTSVEKIAGEATTDILAKFGRPVSKANVDSAVKSALKGS